MSVLINRFYKEATVQGGGAVITTTSIRGLLRHIIIKAASDNTTFDFHIVDDNNLHLFERESVDGEINEEKQIPVQSALQLVISGATAQEIFKVYLGVQEV